MSGFMNGSEDFFHFDIGVLSFEKTPINQCGMNNQSSKVAIWFGCSDFEFSQAID
jgi:hypothetical protein